MERAGPFFEAQRPRRMGQLKYRQITEAGGFTLCSTALPSRYCASRSQHSAIMIKTARVSGETRSVKRRHSSAFRR
jgi:hypothetical protein